VSYRRWEMPEDPPPRRPYRSTLVFHLALAGIIVLVAYLTGGSLRRAIAYAAFFFVAATAWAWWKWRQRLALARREGAGHGGTS